VPVIHLRLRATAKTDLNETFSCIWQAEEHYFSCYLVEVVGQSVQFPFHARTAHDIKSDVCQIGFFCHL